MATSNLLLNHTWALRYEDREIPISVSMTRNGMSSIVAVSETGGIGSVFDVNKNGVECYLGSRGDGVPEAFARSLTDILNVQTVLLTLAVTSLDADLAKTLLSSIRSHTDTLG